MTMFAAAIDHEGSGALQYLKPDLFMTKEIRFVTPKWNPYIALSNTMTVANTFVLTVPSDATGDEFEAKKNLQAVRSGIRSLAAVIDPVIAGDAEGALRRMQERDGEQIDKWADRLARDVSSHRD